MQARPNKSHAKRKKHARNATRDANTCRHKANAAICGHGSQSCTEQWMTNLPISELQKQVWKHTSNTCISESHAPKPQMQHVRKRTSSIKRHRKEMAGDMPSPSTSQTNAKTHMLEMCAKTKGITSNKIGKHVPPQA